MAATVRRWRVQEPAEDACARLRGELGVSPLLARLLANRGFDDPAAAERFLTPTLSKSLRSPDLFEEMGTAASRILAAVRGGERIAVYGDYDVDGITASTELLLFLREIGCEPIVHIPHRMKDGYGLRVESIRELAARGARVLITADCGAASHAEIAEANRLGLDVIVCDHHQNPATRPPALAVLNPVVRTAGFPFAGLCAAGVVFYLLMGTRMRLRESGAAVPDLRPYLDLAALGTVADLVPLLEENRVLVKYGLREIARARRIGLKALLDVSGAGTVNVETLGFRLGPRLNASGRLADASRAVELLVSASVDDARRIAQELDGHNRSRREIEDATLAEAEAMIQALDGEKPRRSYVLASEGWHPGVVGIVASRLVDRHFRPVVLLAIEGEKARGSARGIPAVHLYEALGGCVDWLERFGGHRMAAGLSLRAENVGRFAERFEEVVTGVTTDDSFTAELRIDARIALDAVTDGALEDLERLEPCGQQNPRPSFLAEGVRVLESRVVGEQHLKLTLRDAGGKDVRRAIAFRQGGDPPAVGSAVDIVFTPEIDVWEGRERLQLNVRALRKTS